MKRTIRNGLVIAGMAGGMLFLGQAVAQADAENENQSENTAVAANSSETNVDTSVNGGNGGVNVAAANTGAIVGGGGVSAAQSSGSGEQGGTSVETGDVAVHQEANGGDVSKSGNVHVSGGPTQNAEANATTTVDQTATVEGSGKKGKKGGGDAENTNTSENTAVAANSSETNVDTSVNGGNGGVNVAAANTGAIIGGGFGEPGRPEIMGDSTSSEYGGSSVEVETGDVEIDQEANGGDVSKSGNVHVSGGPTQNAEANATTTVDQTASVEGYGKKGKKKGGSSDAENTNDSENTAVAANSSSTNVSTSVNGGDGGENIAAANTGLILIFGFNSLNESEESEEGGFSLHTGDVAIHQEANGGDVKKSGNVHVEGGPTQNAEANATTTVTQTATVEGYGKKGKKKGGSSDAENTNDSENTAVAANSSSTSVSTSVNGGNGGLNFAEANTGLILFFGFLATNEESEEGGFSLHTGDVDVHQDANGGDVKKSGNVHVEGGAEQNAAADATTTVTQTATVERYRLKAYKK